MRRRRSKRPDGKPGWPRSSGSECPSFVAWTIGSGKWTFPRIGTRSKRAGPATIAGTCARRSSGWIGRELHGWLITARLIRSKSHRYWPAPSRSRTRAGRAPRAPASCDRLASSRYERQARQLAAWGQLELSFLEHDGKAISASYGYRAKGVSFYHKVGYDAAYEGYSPGQALLYHLLRKQGVDGEPALLDFVGPLQEWTSKWATRTYALGRVVIAPRLAGRALLQAYTHAWPLVVQARQRLRREPIAARPRPDGEVSSAAEEKAAEPVPVENAST